mgnify:CR=1 FL=1
MCRKCDIDINFKTMRKYLSTLLVASVLAASCTKDAEVIREKIVSQSRPILSGQGQPENTKGEDGDYYLDLANADLYGPKTKGTWGAPALNLKGVVGKDGKDGANGTNGATPRIGDNGNWWVGNTDLGVKAQGTQGQKGQDGATPRIGNNGNWWVGNTDLGLKAQGAQGQKGQDGATPRIGDNGNWWVGNTDLGVKAQGAQGQKGQDGRNGRDGAIPSIGDNGNWWIGNQDTGKPARGAQGQKGQDGAIPSIGDNGNWWVGDQDTGKPARGEQGERGVAGQNGQNGADGSKILAEDRAPQASDGVVGDYFIDKDAKIFYGPKTTSGWPSTGISLTGAPRATVDYQLSEDGKTLVKWLNPKTSYIDMNLDPKLRDVTTIADGAFSVPGLRDRLSTIIIGDDVTEIQASAFHGCGALRRVELPEGLTAIAPNTFEACMSLQYINIPETVTSIGSYAFANCTKLKKITIPKGVGRFEARTFVGCTALKTLVLENPIAFNIDQVSNAFAGTTLTSIFVPHAAKQAYKDANRADRKAIIKSVVIE